MNKKMPHDYQCNAAMGLQKRLKESMGPESAPKNPREVAERIVASMPRFLVYCISFVFFKTLKIAEGSTAFLTFIWLLFIFLVLI